MGGIFIVLIVLIAVAGIITLTAINGHFALEERKIDAILRQQEINDGVAPGTYSRPYKNKKAYKKAQKEFNEMKAQMDSKSTKNAKSEDQVREELLNGIKNLQERIDNIDTIMESKQKERDK